MDGNATDFFDITARHRLAVGDDGQGFEHRTAIARGLLGVQFFKVTRQLWVALKTPTAGYFSQLQAAFSPFTTDLFE